MIELGSEAALIVVGIAVTVVTAWGSSISVRSAARGPRWALGHLARVRPLVLGGVGTGLILTILARPVWAGLAVLYVALTVLLLSTMLKRALLRLEESGGLEELPIERRREIVSRARRLIMVAGVLLAVIGIGSGVAGAGAVGWIPGLLGVTLFVTGVALSAEVSDSPV